MKAYFATLGATSPAKVWGGLLPDAAAPKKGTR